MIKLWIMKRVSVFLVFLICVFSLNAQTLEVLGPPIYRDTVPKVYYDCSQYRIFYRYVFIKDPADPYVTTEATTVLQVGDKYNKFFDYYKIPYDSVAVENCKQRRTLNESFPFELPYLDRVKYDPVLLTDLEKNELELVERVFSSGTYRYREPVPDFDWHYESGDSTILSYPCQKATMTFRGRSYVAWYCPDLALPYGPFKFGGLPGLIFCIYDSDREHVFTITAIEQMKAYDPIYMVDSKNIFDSHREAVRKVFRYVTKNASKAMNSSGKFKIEGRRPSLKKEIPWNPIEKE